MNKVWKYNRLLTLALFALAVIALVSCEKEPQETGDDPVAFDSSLKPTATKATLPNNTTFAVFGWYQPGVIGGAAGVWPTNKTTPNFMYNEDVTFTSPSSYTYTPIKYWPNNPENTVTFWAYCPHNAAGLTLSESSGGSAYSNESTSGIPYLDFTTITGHALIDLMRSDFDSSVKDLSKPSLSTPVHFVFRHLLSRIVFSFIKVGDASNNFDVRLTEVEILGIYQTAGHPGYDSNSLADTWTGYDDLGDLSVYEDTTPEATTDNPVVNNAGTTTMAVMPIPQILTGSTTAKIRISYVVIPSGGGDPVPNQGEALITSLHTGWDDPEHPTGWEENYQYTYNVQITPGGKPIVFNAIIEPWGSTVTWEHHYVD